MDQDGGGARARRRIRPVSETDSLRVPPQSVEAEQAVLGGLLLDNKKKKAIESLRTTMSRRNPYDKSLLVGT
jgi:hypothetical protein